MWTVHANGGYNFCLFKVYAGFNLCEAFDYSCCQLKLRNYMGLSDEEITLPRKLHMTVMGPG
jgi:hypothetical protein